MLNQNCLSQRSFLRLKTRAKNMTNHPMARNTHLRRLQTKQYTASKEGLQNQWRHRIIKTKYEANRRDLSKLHFSPRLLPCLFGVFFSFSFFCYFPGWCFSIIIFKHWIAFCVSGAFNLLFFPMQCIWPVNTDKMRFNTYIYIFWQQNLSWCCWLQLQLQCWYSSKILWTFTDEEKLFTCA